MELPSEPCCARILVFNFGFEGKISCRGAVEVDQFRVWSTWVEHHARLVQGCVKLTESEQQVHLQPLLHLEFRVQFLAAAFLCLVAVPADWETPVRF